MFDLNDAQLDTLIEDWNVVANASFLVNDRQGAVDLWKKRARETSSRDGVVRAEITLDPQESRQVYLRPVSIAFFSDGNSSPTDFVPKTPDRFIPFTLSDTQSASIIRRWNEKTRDIYHLPPHKPKSAHAIFLDYAGNQLVNVGATGCFIPPDYALSGVHDCLMVYHWEVSLIKGFKKLACEKETARNAALPQARKEAEAA